MTQTKFSPDCTIHRMKSKKRKTVTRFVDAKLEPPETGAKVLSEMCWNGVYLIGFGISRQAALLAVALYRFKTIIF